MTTITPPDDLPIAMRRARRAASTLHSLAHHEVGPASQPAAADRGTPRRSRRVAQIPPASSSRAVSTGLTPTARGTSLATPPSSKRRRHTAPLGSDALPPTPPAGDVHHVPLHHVLDGRVQRRPRRGGLAEELNRSGERRQHKQTTVQELERLRADLRARDAEIYELRNATIVVDTERIWDLEAQVEQLTRQLTDERERNSPAAAAADIPTADIPTITTTTAAPQTPRSTPRNAPRAVWATLGVSPFAASPFAVSPFAASPFAVPAVPTTPYDDGLDAIMGEEDETPTELNTDDEGDELGDDAALMAELLGDTPRPPVCRVLAWPAPSSSSPSGSRTTNPTTASGFSRTGRASLSAMTIASASGSASDSAKTATVGCQTSFVDGNRGRDRDQQMVRLELDSLQLELAKLTKTLESYSSLSDRLSSRMAHAIRREGETMTTATNTTMTTTTTTTTTPRDIEQQLDALLRLLTDRTASVAHLTSALGELGFPGDDAGAMVASLSSGFRAARLELEYLTPGEIALPLTSHGAEVLDLLLSRLRELGRRGKEDEAALDEYRALEGSLRQQLAARVEAMDALGAELVRAQRLLDDKSFRIQELESSVDRLKGAVNGYASDVGQLESAARVARDSFRRQLGERDDRLRVLEGLLAGRENRAAVAPVNLAAKPFDLDETEVEESEDDAYARSENVPPPAAVAGAWRGGQSILRPDRLEMWDGYEEDVW